MGDGFLKQKNKKFQVYGKGNSSKKKNSFNNIDEFYKILKKTIHSFHS